MKATIAALAAPLLVATSVQLTPAAPLAPPLPSGVSDEIVFSGPNTLPNQQIIPEGSPEAGVVFECDSGICIPGASVALTEPGQPNVVSDLLTVSGGGALAGALAPQDLVLPVDILFRSDSEGGAPLVAPPGAVFLAETGDRQDLSALIFQPAALALGFQLTVQSDIEAVAAPELPSAALLILGALAVAGRRHLRSRPARPEDACRIIVAATARQRGCW
jgi:hypothetical protein